MEPPPPYSPPAPWPPPPAPAPAGPPPSYHPVPPGYLPPPQAYRPPPQAPYGYGATVYQPVPGGYNNVPFAPPLKKPENYRILSIITILVFCLCLGFVAYYYSQKVDKAWFEGDHVGARRNSLYSRNWNIAGMVCGGMVGLCGFFLIGVAEGLAGNG